MRIVFTSCKIVSGDNHMSPGVLASMWKEEEARIKSLEEKMTTLLKEKAVKIAIYSLLWLNLTLIEQLCRVCSAKCNRDMLLSVCWVNPVVEGRLECF